MLALPMPTTRTPELPVNITELAIQRHVSEPDVARLAYALWEQRGCPEGSSEEDWFRAEQELWAGRASF